MGEGRVCVLFMNDVCEFEQGHGELLGGFDRADRVVVCLGGWSVCVWVCVCMRGGGGGGGAGAHFAHSGN